ncbi:NUCLEAR TRANSCRIPTION FACTOR X-BOX BINDING 1 NFX1 [Salix purpurea]|uniref:NUCLEAR TRANSCRIPTION FACTOR X-BOX BINDING 1 NFX1 n=1 Tax=Salix purpurea TaxID=77065 RepID=A0A9Q0W3P8_SALPP|nr:NUCLEAR TRANSCRIPTION FACTOR X-BOX BINDING 1 NFX1 [Salix purpurea]
MSFQPRNDRRDNNNNKNNRSSRFPTQKWVPRGGNSNPAVDANTNPPSSSNSRYNVNGGDGAAHGWPGTTQPRGHVGQPRKGIEKSEKTRESSDPNLPQLAQDIQGKLVKSTVECMICYDMVRRSVPIWSCSSCFSIFHLKCIKKWARAPTSVDLATEKNQGFNWRCPGCQSVQLTALMDIQYICFCGKRRDPPSDLYLTPHSCGEPCGKPLEKEAPGADRSKEDLCPHNCVLQCHPGPCPSCKAFAPPRMCPCGKKIITTRCADRMSVLTCGQSCDKLLECWRHRCERICHVGPCDSCRVSVSASCFCKKKMEVVLCGDLAVKGEVKAEDGVFSCNATCGKMLDCGNHMCDETCHPGPCGDCELMPARVGSCHCGKTSLQKERKSCLDPIPTCTQICGKSLPCGMHRCKGVCHSGDCALCLVFVTQKCRCGSTSQTVECYKTTSENEKFMCEKPCGRKKNCGRHRCSQRCCPLSNSNSQLSGDWDPHFCQMACGKKLRRTSVPPPLPCGTPPPSCQLPCSTKECVGGHVILGNIPCGSSNIRCNKLCGKTRQCGLHACGRTCHSLPCDTSFGNENGTRASCGQTCGAPKRDCKHTCTARCHPRTPCPDVRCEFLVTISCSCGRMTASVPCDAGGSDGGYNDNVLEASILHKLPASLQPVESNGKKIPLGQRKLMCVDECAKLERKRVLANAFDIAPPNLEALHFGENSAVTELIGDLYRRDPKWVLAVEERCKYLVLGKSRGTTSGLKIHVFCPMLKDKRDAVRLIAERWRLAIYSAGWEPKRFIVVHPTPKSKPPPRVIGIKGATTSISHPPVFDVLVDLDPRLVVSFLDLPREADISSLVLRFGGECELVRFNDKNALAVFNDPARAATAMRRLDHGSLYHGASVVPQNTGASLASPAYNACAVAGTAMEGAGAALKGTSWKKAVVQESGCRKDSWGGEEWSDGGGSADFQASAWKGKEAPAMASMNRWSVLDSENADSSSAASVKIEDPDKQVAGIISGSGLESSGSTSDTSRQPAMQSGGVSREEHSSEVVDDWEKACD